MKKLILIVLLFSFLISGCENNTRTDETEDSVRKVEVKDSIIESKNYDYLNKRYATVGSLGSFGYDYSYEFDTLKNQTIFLEYFKLIDIVKVENKFQVKVESLLGYYVQFNCEKEKMLEIKNYRPNAKYDVESMVFLILKIDSVKKIQLMVDAKYEDEIISINLESPRYFKVYSTFIDFIIL
jgi:hypothetical protein